MRATDLPISEGRLKSTLLTRRHQPSEFVVEATNKFDSLLRDKGKRTTMTMNVVIHDLVSGECELSGKSNVECVRVTLDDKTPEAVISTAEFVKFLRFKKKQASKGNAALSPSSATKTGKV